MMRGEIVMATRQFVIFAINNEEFGLDIGQVGSIERPLEIFKIPNTPEYLEGLVNLRGKVYTVFNLRTRFEMPKKDIDDSSRIIMANTGSAIVGLIVDEVREISKVEDKDFESTPKSLSNLERKYISGIAKINERIILLLDLDIILAVQNVV
jgi:purine-binding chemotaxis protein CheW